MSSGIMIFVVMVFVTVFLLAQSIVVPAFGDNRRLRQRLRQRLAEIEHAADGDSFASLLREKYLRQLSPAERWLETLPGMERLARIIEQAGHQMPAYRLVLISAVAALVAAFAGWSFTRSWLWAAGFSVAAVAAPLLKVMRDRKQRIEKFEEQLPDAIDSMKRAVQAGHPFGSAVQLVAEDMDEPLAREFQLTFADINYGNDLRRAMLGLLQRVPSVSVMALVTAVLVQRETGGNLAEILERISHVIRGRFRFYRKVRTLSAEGRLSAWILALIPFVMFVVISLTTPTYLPVLLEDPVGIKLIGLGCIMGFIGIVWIRKIIRIEA